MISFSSSEIGSSFVLFRESFSIVPIILKKTIKILLGVKMFLPI